MKEVIKSAGLSTADLFEKPQASHGVIWQFLGARRGLLSTPDARRGLLSTRPQPRSAQVLQRYQAAKERLATAQKIAAETIDLT